MKLNNQEFYNLKNKNAISAVIRIIIYSLISMAIMAFLFDGIFNNELANSISETNRTLYLFCVSNKSLILIGVYAITTIIIAFIVIRNMNQDLVDIINAIDGIIKEPTKEIKLKNRIILLENRLNEIRINLITSQNEAKDAENKKNDLIMYMAHDIKTPLTSTIGYLTLLTDEKEISKKSQEKYTKIALKKALRVEELTNQFFEITKYDLHEMPITKQKIDLSFLIDQLIDECYPMLQERKLTCKAEKPEHIYYMGDGDKMARAFENILKNAINYSYEKSNIEIKIEDNENEINITFKNKGDKIPEYKLEKIFEKFYRADESRESSTGGSGLGLAITKEIIEAHGGNISVKNDDEYIEFEIKLEKGN